ncbi:aldehyde dehydrogenase [Sphingomonas sp. DBB INV C78]|uniref:aldehyde dehydrogenase n=1 Tax=Sphingomonas sp. DBB INV C78 TaxID=3349434 RepID=UPI0036D35A58
MTQGLSDNLAKAESIALPNMAVVDGELRPALAGGTFDNISSRDGRLLAQVAAGEAADIDIAVAAARRAFADGRWRNLAPKAKKKILHKLADLMESHAEELALLESLDTGKPIRDAQAVDIPLATDSVRYYAEALDKVYGEVGPHHPGRLSYAVHEPLGVIGAIVPWNFPLHMAMWKVAPALAMGNSIVLKPAEQSPMTAIRVAELALEAGLPPGVFNVVPGLGETAGKALALHMDVDMIAFTGSGVVGRLLMQYSGQSNLKRVSLELGGKSPQIIFPDCPDIAGAARGAAWSIFYNQGQVCTAASRLLVHEDIRAEFMAEVVKVASRIEAGDPLDPATRFGAMVSAGQMETALRYIETAKAEGAELVLGGGRVREESGGYYVAPTIFDQVTPGATLAREEVFGPVLGVIGFSDEAEAYRIANDTVYGLAAGVWTADLDRAHRAVRALHAGQVWVNGWDADDITMPFGGFKQSGFGRDRSLHAMEKYADLKAVSFTIRGGVA